MIKTKYFVPALICLLLTSCQTLSDRCQVDKRYWTPKDYGNTIRILKYEIEPDETLPTFADPETRIIIEKLTDEQNYLVVLDDNELGTNHKSEIGSKFFDRWKDMSSIYTEIDRTDSYVYDREMLEIFQFGLGLQIKYFKLGNDRLIENADDPNSGRVLRTVNSNVSTLVDNFIIYLDEINNEKAFSEEGKKILSQGIDKYFTQLINLYPKANYREMLNKIELMNNKSQSADIKVSLNKLKLLIDSKKSQS